MRFFKFCREFALFVVVGHAFRLILHIMPQTVARTHKQLSNCRTCVPVTSLSLSDLSCPATILPPAQQYMYVVLMLVVVVPSYALSRLRVCQLRLTSAHVHTRCSCKVISSTTTHRQTDGQTDGKTDGLLQRPRCRRRRRRQIICKSAD